MTTEIIPSTPSTHPLAGQRVIVRAPGSGVFVGTLADVSTHGATLIDAQRIWSWQGALETITLAVTGPSAARMSPAVALACIGDAREIFSLSAIADEKFSAIEVWRG